MLKSLVLVFFFSSLVSAKTPTDAYDDLFKQACALEWADVPDMDCNWLKALSIAESSLNVMAVSPVGAMGLMQIMEATWGDIVRARPDLKRYHVADPFGNIMGGTFYLREQYNGFPDPRTHRQRLDLAFASYNAGRGHIYNAQKIGGPNWPDVKGVLHEVTGRHSKETIGYVSRIDRLHGTLKKFSLFASPAHAQEPESRPPAATASAAAASRQAALEYELALIHI